MKYALSLVFAAFAAVAAIAQDADERSTDDMIVSAQDVDLDALRWEKRALVVFADSPNNPNFIEQMDLIEDDLSALERRDVIVIIDTDPADRTDIRRELRPRGFGIVIVGKDGSIQLRKTTPWSIRELTRTIDKS
jgi:hypothetical protein